MYAYEVTLIWADGKVEKTSSRDRPQVYDGTLRLVVDRMETRSIPLTSLREWSARQI